MTSKQKPKWLFISFTSSQLTLIFWNWPCLLFLFNVKWLFPVFLQLWNLWIIRIKSCFFRLLIWLQPDIHFMFNLVYIHTSQQAVFCKTELILTKYSTFYFSTLFANFTYLKIYSCNPLNWLCESLISWNSVLLYIWKKNFSRACWFVLCPPRWQWGLLSPLVLYSDSCYPSIRHVWWVSSLDFLSRHFLHW